MTKESILKSAIEKAIQNGWPEKGSSIETDGDGRLFQSACDDCYACDIVIKGKDVRYVYITERELLFNHGFAKAFWGDDLSHHMVLSSEITKCDNCGYGYTNNKEIADVSPENIFYVVPGGQIYLSPLHTPCKKIGWKYHLQQMVISPDPILYLAKFL